MLATLFILFVSLFFSSCDSNVEVSENTFSLISWNVQTLFDSTESGNEYSAFTKRYGWSKERYNNRIQSLGEVLKKSAFSSADVIFFQEVENSRVLEDLLTEGLRRRGFIYFGVIECGEPISVGFISKIKPFETIVHYADSQRAIMQLRFMLPHHTISIFNLHAKSNLGEEEENLRLRKEYARYLNTLIKDNSDDKIIVLGDFNTTLRLDTLDMLSSSEALHEKVIIKESSIPVSTTKEGTLNYSLYDPLLDKSLPFPGEGSYYYQGEWTRPDHILLSRALIDVSSHMEISIISDYTSDSRGLPYGYDTSLWSGYSDHFPLRLDLSF